MKVYCPRCRSVIASKDRRKKSPVLKDVTGQPLSSQVSRAPRVKCWKCGMVTIYVEGSVA